MASKADSAFLESAVEDKDVSRLMEWVDTAGKDAVVKIGTWLSPPLVHCSRLDFTAGVKWLLEQRADVHATGLSTSTALHLAKSAAVVKALLAAGADLEVENSGGTPLCWAAYNGWSEPAAALIAAGANVNFVTEHGWTPLTLASKNGHKRVAQLLLAAGADVMFRVQRQTAEEIAIRRKHRKVAAVIRAGAAAARAVLAAEKGPADDADPAEEGKSAAAVVAAPVKEAEVVDGDMPIADFLTRVSNAFADKYTAAFVAQDIETVAHLAAAGLGEEMATALGLSVGAKRMIRSALSSVRIA